MVKITGDSTSFSFAGTLVVDGEEHTFDCEGSEGERGTHATVDGKTHWWWGGHDDNGEMEMLVEDAFEAAVKFVEKESGLDASEIEWSVEYDGQNFSNMSITDDE